MPRYKVPVSMNVSGFVYVEADTPEEAQVYVVFSMGEKKILHKYLAGCERISKFAVGDAEEE